MLVSLVNQYNSSKKYSYCKGGSWCDRKSLWKRLCLQFKIITRTNVFKLFLPLYTVNMNCMNTVHCWASETNAK